MAEPVLVRAWIDAAHESLRAANSAFDAGFHRSAVSRAYYALYQAGTAMILHTGMSPPLQGNWTHAVFPTMFESKPLRRVLRRRAIEFKQIASLVYADRCDADYCVRARVDASQSFQDRRYAGMVLDTACRITGYDPRRRT